MDHREQQGRSLSQHSGRSPTRAHALGRQVDQACATGHDALDLAEQMSSARAVAHGERLLDDLKPWRHDPMVKDLTDRARLAVAPM
jgi:hypothetical protein